MPLAFDNSDGEIWFQPCRYDGTVEGGGRNPFTGKPSNLPRNAPLTASEEKAVRAVIAAARTKAEKSGTPLDLFDRNVATGFMINPRGRDYADLVGLIYEVLVAGNWCFVTDDALVVASMASVQGLPVPHPDLPADYPLPPRRVVLVASAEDLALQLRE